MKKHTMMREQEKKIKKKSNGCFAKNSILIFFLFCSTLVLSQEGTQFDPELDSIKQVLVIKYHTDVNSILKLSQILIQKAKEKNKPYYEVRGYSYIDKLYRDNSDYKKLVQSTETTIAFARKNKIKLAELEALGNRAWALVALGFVSDAKKTLDEGELLINTISEKTDKENCFIGDFYLSYVNYYMVLENYKAAIKKQEMAITFYQKIRNNDTRKTSILVSYINMGDLYVRSKNTDSAFYYAKKSQELLNTLKHYDKRYQLNIYSEQAEILIIQNKHKLAIPILIKALDLSKKNNFDELSLDFLKSLNICFAKTKDNSSPYYLHYLAISKTYEENNTLNFGEKAAFFFKNNYYIRNFGFVIILILLTTTSIIIYVKNQKTKKIADQLFVQKQENEKNTEIIASQKMTLEEIIELAKNNESAFLMHFSEYNTAFYNKLCTDFPELSNTQKKVIALSYLYFTTKDIANITNTSLRTIQNHKYNIRKILKMDKSQNFLDGIRNLDLEKFA